MSDVVTYEVDGRTAIITINREDKLNALDEDVIQGLRSCLLHYDGGDERCAILAAKGDRAFSVGADIRNPPKEMWEGVPGVGVVTDKPIIGCVQGYCVGGAWILIQMCDLAVAADNTVFKYPEAQVGFTGGLIAGAAAKIPHKLAMEFMLLGQDIPADRAAEMGMVNRVVPLGEQMNAALEYARILEESAPLVVQTIKNLVFDTVPKGPAEIAAIARDKLMTVRNSEDGAEGRLAFSEKRKPDFKGR